MERNRESAVRNDLQQQAAIPVLPEDSYPANVVAAAGQHNVGFGRRGRCRRRGTLRPGRWHPVAVCTYGNSTFKSTLNVATCVRRPVWSIRG